MREIEIRTVRSRRKTMALEIRPDLSVILRIPYCVTDREAERFLKEKEDWIRKHIKKMQKNMQEREKIPVMGAEELRSLAEQALSVIPEKVKQYAALIGVTYGRITIRNQKTRWGSCSAKGNLNFNCLLMLAPERVMDYVVIHELCHRLEMNHSGAFWAHVEAVMPDYKAQRNWLREHGDELMRRMGV